MIRFLLVEDAIYCVFIRIPAPLPSRFGPEEITMLLQHMGEHIMDAGDHQFANRFLKKANETASRARIIHDSVFEHERISGDCKYKGKGG